MASSIALHSGSPLVGSPVVFDIVPSDLSDKTALTFHKVVLQAEISLDGGASSVYSFSHVVAREGGDYHVQIDISSALRSVADSYEYTPHLTAGEKQYPVLSVDVSAWDEYLEKGDSHTTTPIQLQTSLHFLLGGFTDYERINSGLTRDVTTLTRKPITLEVVPHANYLHIAPPSYLFMAVDWAEGEAPDAPTSIAIDTSILALGKHQLSANTHGIYVSDNDDPYVPIQFINGYGVVESIAAITLTGENIEKVVAKHTKTAPMAFNKINRQTARKSSSKHVFELSSGPVTLDWLRWWQDEFLNTSHAWVKISGTWVPCSIIPEDSVAGTDYTEGKLPEVVFALELNINGIY
ncbi:MAG: hypothetical protein IJ557_02490 [Bacteroidaceae bacterium]|nr:hypothetical protein [Bacteroidaceae bacterium]